MHLRRSTMKVTALMIILLATAQLALSAQANPTDASKRCVWNGDSYDCFGTHPENADGSGPLCVGTWTEDGQGHFVAWKEKICP
jgi:hypothetical protein